MGDSKEILSIKEKFVFSAYNRAALNPAKHIHDEKLRFVPAPTTPVQPPELVLARTPAFYTGFTQAGGTTAQGYLFCNRPSQNVAALNAKFEFGTKFTPFTTEIFLMSDEPLVNDIAGNVDLEQESAFQFDGFIAKDITKEELAETMLAKLLLGEDVNLENMPYVAVFAVSNDIRNGRTPYDARKPFQPFMVSTSMSDAFKGADNPLRTEFGPDNTMKSMFDLTLLRALMQDTTANEMLTLPQWIWNNSELSPDGEKFADVMALAEYPLSMNSRIKFRVHLFPKEIFQMIDGLPNSVSKSANLQLFEEEANGTLGVKLEDMKKSWENIRKAEIRVALERFRPYMNEILLAKPNIPKFLGTSPEGQQKQMDSIFNDMLTDLMLASHVIKREDQGCAELVLSSIIHAANLTQFMQRSLLQIVWAAMVDLPLDRKFNDRHDEPERMFLDFDELINRTTLNFTLNFLLACPSEFFSSPALVSAVNCNSRADALQSTEELLKLFADWKPIKHLYSVDTYDPTLVEKMDYPIAYWLLKVKELMTSSRRLAGRWTTIRSELNEAYNKVEKAIDSNELIDSCVRKIAKILVVMVKRPKELFHSEPWIATIETLTSHLSETIDLDLELCEKIKQAEFFSKRVPSRLVIEVGKSLESDGAMMPLMNPKIFENISEPIQKMSRKFRQSFMAHILQDIANKNENSVRTANGGIPMIFLFDPCWRKLKIESERQEAREAWTDAFMPYKNFMHMCQDEDFKPILLEQSRNLTLLNTEKFNLHCMKVVMTTLVDGQVKEIYCDETLTFGHAYCPLHLTTGVANKRIAVFEKISKLIRDEEVEKFAFGRNVTIRVPRPDTQEYQFHMPNMVGVEETFQAEVEELGKVIHKCYRYYKRSDDMTKFNEHAFRFSLGSPAPFPSWRILYAVIKEKVKLFGFDLDEDWRAMLNILASLVTTQGWSKVSKSFLSPYGENIRRAEYSIKSHDSNAVCYNATAPTEGRLLLQPRNGLQYAPKRKIDQQELPLYSVETDLLAKVDDFAAVMYVGIASRILYMDVRNTNKDQADAVLRNDPNTNAGFKFAFLNLINITDSNKPVEHNLSEDDFSAGGASLTEEESNDMVEELNQKGGIRKGKRAKVADNRLIQSPRSLPYGFSQMTLKGEWEAQDEMTQEEIKRARLLELEAPVIQAKMIDYTNKMAKKKIKLVFFSAGKQTITRLAKDCFNFSCSIDQALYQSEYWKDYFQNAERLCDMIKSPLVMVCPEPLADGNAYEHPVRMTPEHIELWSSDQKVRYEAHIESQQVDTFHVQMTVVANSKLNPMRTYLKNWHGNPLLAAAISGLENALTLTRDFPRYNVKYEKGPITKAGERINLKVIACPNHRLRVMSQLIKNNVGDKDTYTMMRNWFIPADPEVEHEEIPTFVTAHTYPPIPENLEFKCSSLAANAEDFVRASALITIDCESDGTDEENRLHALIGVGVGAPGQFLGLYGSANFPGGQTMEYRNELVCKAFGDNEKDTAEEEIENFFFNMPQGNAENVAKQIEAHKAALEIYKLCLGTYQAAKLEVTGIDNLRSFDLKYPYHFSDSTDPVTKYSPLYSNVVVNKSATTKRQESTTGPVSPQAKAYLENKKFIDTKTNYKWRAASFKQQELAEVSSENITNTITIERITEDDIVEQASILIGQYPYKPSFEQDAIDWMNVINKTGFIYRQEARALDARPNTTYIERVKVPANYNTLFRLAHFVRKATSEDQVVDYLLGVSEYKRQSQWSEKRNRKYETKVKFSQTDYECNLIRLKDIDCEQFETVPKEKKELLSNALNTIFTTAIVLAKLDVVKSSLTLLGMEPTDFRPSRCVTIPQIYAKILFLVNKEENKK